VIRFRILELLLLAACVWRWRDDHFEVLNTFGDTVERKLPPKLAWLGWKKGGNPISWLQHLLWASLAGLVGGALALWSSYSFLEGFREFFTLVAVGFYVPREIWNARNHIKTDGWKAAFWIARTHPYTGWFWDGLGDLSPLWVAIFLWVGL